MSKATIIDTFKNWWNKPLIRRGIYLTLAVLCLFILIRACSSPSKVPVTSYRVARDASWYPIELIAKEYNMVGFTDELLAAVGETEDIRISILDVGSAVLFFGLGRDQWEGVLSALTPEVANNQQYIFSKPFYTLGLALVVRDSSPITSFEELNNKLVGIPKDISLPPFIAQQNALFTPYMANSSGIDDLIHNRIDAVIMDFTSAKVYEQSVYDNQIKVVSGPFMERGLRLVARRQKIGIELIQDFDAALERLQTNGIYQQMLMKWDLVAQ